MHLVLRQFFAGLDAFITLIAQNTDDGCHQAQQSQAPNQHLLTYIALYGLFVVFRLNLHYPFLLLNIVVFLLPIHNAVRQCISLKIVFLLYALLTHGLEDVNSDTAGFCIFCFG